MLKLIDKMLQI